MLRATFVVVRVGAFLTSLLLFLFAHLFLPEAPLGARELDGGAAATVTSFVYSICAGLGTFLLLFGAWTYRVQRLIARLALGRLLFARAVIVMLVFASAMVLAACLTSVAVARFVMTAGAILAGLGFLVAVLAKGPRYSRSPRPG